MVGVVHQPRTLAELSDAVRESTSLDVVGSDSKRRLRIPVSADAMLSMRGLSGIVEWSREDQVVTVNAGTSVRELQAMLSESGQCLPTSATGTIGGALSMNLPHPGEGSWKDWMLGATVVLSDGRIAKSGSRVVKSVAGYDVHKLAIGSRGSFFVVATVTLRTFSGAPPEPHDDDQLPKRADLDPVQLRLMRRAKSIFDPTSKLNAGEWGDF